MTILESNSYYPNAKLPAVLTIAKDAELVKKVGTSGDGAFVSPGDATINLSVAVERPQS